MAIQVYGPGDTHTVDGHQCTIVTCEIETYHELKDQGYVDDVRELYPDLYPVEEPKTEEQSDDLEPKTEEKIDLLDAPEFLTQNIPVDKADKSKNK